jgi:hypothetical protein
MYRNQKPFYFFFRAQLAPSDQCREMSCVSRRRT